MHYKHILFAADGSEQSRKAEKECIAFAGSIGAKVTVLHVISHYHLHVRSWAVPKSMLSKIETEHEEEARKSAREMVAALVKDFKASGIRCEGEVVVGEEPYAEIVRSAGNRQCDLIMMASHGRRGIDAVLLGSETTKVLTHATVPVLVVR